MTAATADSAPFPPGRTVLIVLIVAFASFVQMLDSSILATAIPRMAISFHVEPTDLAIGVTSYVIAAVIVIPLCGWLSGVFGPRLVFFGGLAGFAVASALCGLSQTLDQFIAARLFQGLVGGVLWPVGSHINLSSVRLGDRIRMNNIAAAPVLIAPVLGPPVGGLITTYLSWHWIFYLNVPICVAGAALSLFYLHDPESPRRPFDVKGLVLNTTASATLIYGLSEIGGTVMRWQFAAALAGFGLVVGVFAVRHARRAAHPLLSLESLRFPIFRRMSLYVMPILRLPMATIPFALPIMLQVGFGMTAALSGALFLAHAAGDLMMRFGTTRTFRRFGFRAPLIASAAGLCATQIACGLFTAYTPGVVIASVLLVGGWFRCFMGAGLGTLSYCELPTKDIANAVTTNQIFMQLGNAFAVALTVILMQSADLFAEGTPAEIALAECRAALILGGLLTLTGALPLRRLPRDAGAEMSGHRPRGVEPPMEV
jgi:MFS family permease